MPQATHLITLLRSVLLLLEERGHHRQALLQLLGQDESSLQNPLVRTPVANSNALWQLAYEHCGPQMGLEVARYIRPTDLQSIGAAIATAENVEQAILWFERYISLFADIAQLEVASNDAQLRFSLCHDQPLPPTHERLEAMALYGLNLISGVLDSPLETEHVELTRPEPENSRAWQEAFNGKLSWGHEKLSVIISRQQASRRLLTHNPDLQQSSNHFLNKLLHEKSQTDPLAAIRHEMQRYLDTPDLKLEQIAHNMHMGARSLQRRLQASQTTFRELFNQLRMEKAIQYFDEGKNAKEVSYLLGYTEPTVFHRAFKKWSGKNPSAYYSNPNN